MCDSREPLPSPVKSSCRCRSASLVINPLYGKRSSIVENPMYGMTSITSSPSKAMADSQVTLRRKSLPNSFFSGHELTLSCGEASAKNEKHSTSSDNLVDAESAVMRHSPRRCNYSRISVDSGVRLSSSSYSEPIYKIPRRMDPELLHSFRSHDSGTYCEESASANGYLPPPEGIYDIARPLGKIQPENIYENIPADDPITWHCDGDEDEGGEECLPIIPDVFSLHRKKSTPVPEDDDEYVCKDAEVQFRNSGRDLPRESIASGIYEEISEAYTQPPNEVQREIYEDIDQYQRLAQLRVRPPTPPPRTSALFPSLRSLNKTDAEDDHAVSSADSLGVDRSSFLHYRNHSEPPEAVHRCSGDDHMLLHFRHASEQPESRKKKDSSNIESDLLQESKCADSSRVKNGKIQSIRHSQSTENGLNGYKSSDDFSFNGLNSASEDDLVEKDRSKRNLSKFFGLDRISNKDKSLKYQSIATLPRKKKKSIKLGSSKQESKEPTPSSSVSSLQDIPQTPKQRKNSMERKYSKKLRDLFNFKRDDSSENSTEEGGNQKSPKRSPMRFFRKISRDRSASPFFQRSESVKEYSSNCSDSAGSERATPTFSKSESLKRSPASIPANLCATGNPCNRYSREKLFEELPLTPFEGPTGAIIQSYRDHKDCGKPGSPGCKNLPLHPTKRDPSKPPLPDNHKNGSDGKFELRCAKSQESALNSSPYIDMNQVERIRKTSASSRQGSIDSSTPERIRRLSTSSRQSRDTTTPERLRKYSASSRQSYDSRPNSFHETSPLSPRSSYIADDPASPNLDNNPMISRTSPDSQYGSYESSILGMICEENRRGSDTSITSSRKSSGEYVDMATMQIMAFSNTDVPCFTIPEEDLRMSERGAFSLPEKSSIAKFCSQRQAGVNSKEVFNPQITYHQNFSKTVEMSMDALKSSDPKISKIKNVKPFPKLA